MGTKNALFAKFGRRAMLVGLGLGASLPQFVLAADAPAGARSEGLEEVIVTAERRSEDIQKTAVAVSVRNGGDLQTEGRYSLANILEDIPGVQGGAAASNLGTAGSGTDNQAAGLVIRGIGSNIGIGGGITSVASAAAIYVDGVYEGVGGDYDIDRVEALRGPQGTLYGRSATSGLVSIHTRDPKLGEFGGNVSAEVGDYGLKHYSGGVNLPMGSMFALRVSGNQYERNGFDSEEGGSINNKDGRVKLLFQPNDRVSALFGVSLENNVSYLSGTTIYLTHPNDKYSITQVPASISPGFNRYRQYWGQLNWDVGFGQLTWLTAYRQWESQINVYSRSTVPAIGSFDEAAQTPVDNFLTHEIHLTSKPGSTLTWQVGALYYDNDLHNSNAFVRQPSGAFYRSQNIQRYTTAWSGFGEATYPITADTRVTAGVRYDSTTVQVNELFLNNSNCHPAAPLFALAPNYCLPATVVPGTISGEAGKRVFDKVTYKARLEHDFTPQNMGYAMVSTGVSPGDVVLAPDLRPTSPTFNKPIPYEIKSETLTSFELGSKNRFLDNKLQINGDVFYYDYGGYQASNYNVNGSRNAQGQFIVIPTPTYFVTLTAPVTTYGVELETIYQLTPNDRFDFNYAYTDAYYRDTGAPVSGTTATFGDFNGFTHIPGVVPHAATLAYDHVFEVVGGSKLMFRIDERYRSSHNEGQVLATQLTDPNYQSVIYPVVHTRDEYITDLNGTWTSPKGMYSVSGWVRNLLNNRYKSNVLVGQPTLATNASGTVTGWNAAPSFSSSVGVTPYDPRTYGISVNVNF